MKKLLLALFISGSCIAQKINMEKNFQTVFEQSKGFETATYDRTIQIYKDLRNLVQHKIDMPKRTLLVTIPIYNVGGSLNRNSTTRTN